MKRFVALALLFCLYSFSPASDAQSQARKIQPLPYRDTDGYQVLSSIIEGRTEKLKNGSVSIFHQTVPGDALGEIRAECASRFPREFQSAVEDFDKKAKTTLLLQQKFSIHKEYKFVETMVGVQTGIYSVSAVGFDENKTRAIVLVQYLVRPPGSVILGGDKMLYLLRRTETGWQHPQTLQNAAKSTSTAKSPR
jgi:hypothetical protein